MALKRTAYVRLSVSLAVLIALLGATQLVLQKVAAQGQRGGAPRFEVDPFWPKLPEKWILGETSGVAVDAQDHVWVIQRPHSVSDQEKGAASTPPTAECCTPAPSVIEFDATGNYVQGWGPLQGT